MPHLFVAEPYQRRSVARMLWNQAKADALQAEVDMLALACVLNP